MTTIAQTLLATHEPATVVQTDRAIPYTDDNDVPDNATFSLDLNWEDTGYSLFGLLKGQDHWDVVLKGGFGKTCWGARMDVAGEVDDADPTSAYLTIANDEFVAGKTMGVDLTLTYRYTLSRIKYHRSGFRYTHSWEQEFDTTIGPHQLDLLATLYTIVQVAISLGGVIPFGDIIGALLPQNVGITGFFDKQSGIVESGGKVTPIPQVVGDIDLVHLAETLGFDFVTAVFIAFPPAELPVQAIGRLAELYVNVLSFVTPMVAFGPSFGFWSPVDISITNFSINDVRYDVSGVDTASPARLVGRAVCANVT